MNNKFTIDNLIIGLEKASYRLYDDIDHKRNNDIFFSLAETIFWINTIIERLSSDEGEEWKEIIKALKCAFNYIKHNKNIIDIVQISGGKCYPFTYPYSYGIKYVFIDLTEIVCKKGIELKSYYDTHLKGMEIKPIIEKIVSKLKR
jgi:hypothetical protein